MKNKVFNIIKYILLALLAVYVIARITAYKIMEYKHSRETTGSHVTSFLLEGDDLYYVQDGMLYLINQAAEESRKIIQCEKVYKTPWDSLCISGEKVYRIINGEITLWLDIPEGCEYSAADKDGIYYTKLNDKIKTVYYSTAVSSETSVYEIMNATELKLFPTENSVWCLKEDEHSVQELLCLPKNESGKILKIDEEEYLYKPEMKWDELWTVSQGRNGIMAENNNDLYYLTENECEKLLYEGVEKKYVVAYDNGTFVFTGGEDIYVFDEKKQMVQNLGIQAGYNVSPGKICYNGEYVAYIDVTGTEVMFCRKNGTKSVRLT